MGPSPHLEGIQKALNVIRGGIERVDAETKLMALGYCQTKANRYPKVVMHTNSGRKLAPLGQGIING